MSASYWAPGAQHERFRDLCARFLAAATDAERNEIMCEIYGGRPQIERIVDHVFEEHGETIRRLGDDD